MAYQVFQLPADAPHADEVLGTKRKFWCEDLALGWSLFKSGRPQHDENEAEKAASHLAPLLGLPAARIELAVWASPDGPVRGTLSPHISPDASLEFGNAILERRVDGYPRDEKRTASHTVSLVVEVLGGIRPHPTLADSIATAADQFVGYLLFDAWVGNMDRHHENWAVVQPLVTPSFGRFLADTFDHGSSLGRELTDGVRQIRIDETANVQRGAIENATRRTVSQYATRPRARGRLFRAAVDDSALSPMDAYLEAARLLPTAAEFWVERLRNVQAADERAIFDEFPTDWCSAPMADFACTLLAFNRTRLLQPSDR